MIFAYTMHKSEIQKKTRVKLKDQLKRRGATDRLDSEAFLKSWIRWWTISGVTIGAIRSKFRREAIDGSFFIARSNTSGSVATNPVRLKKKREKLRKEVTDQSVANLQPNRKHVRTFPNIHFENKTIRTEWNRIWWVWICFLVNFLLQHYHHNLNLPSNRSAIDRNLQLEPLHRRRLGSKMDGQTHRREIGHWGTNQGLQMLNQSRKKSHLKRKAFNLLAIFLHFQQLFLRYWYIQPIEVCNTCHRCFLAHKLTIYWHVLWELKGWEKSYFFSKLFSYIVPTSTFTRGIVLVYTWTESFNLMEPRWTATMTMIGNTHHIWEITRVMHDWFSSIVAKNWSLEE